MEAGNNTPREPDDLSDEQQRAAEADAAAFFQDELSKALADPERVARIESTIDGLITPNKQRLLDMHAEGEVSFKDLSNACGLTDDDRALIPKDDIDALERAHEALFIVNDYCDKYGVELEKIGLVLRQPIITPGGQQTTVLEAFSRPETHAIAMEVIDNPAWMMSVLYKK